MGLASRLDRRTTEQWGEIPLVLAHRDPAARLEIKQLLGNAEHEDELKELKAEERRRKAEERKKKTPLNFDHLCHRVHKYMHKDMPWNWGRSREITEAVRVSVGIEKILDQMLERCAPDSPLVIKANTLDAIVTMLEIIVGAPPSYTRRYCVSHYAGWRRRLGQLWKRFTAEEKHTVMVSMRNIVDRMMEADARWQKYGVDDLFAEVLAGYRDAFLDSESEAHEQE